MSAASEIKVLEAGVQAVLTDKLLEGWATSTRDVSIRAHLVTAIVRYFNRVVSSHEYTVERVTAPGILNNIRAALRLWPHQIPVKTEVHVHHNCHHLPTVKADEHVKWLLQDVEGLDLSKPWEEE